MRNCKWKMLPSIFIAASLAGCATLETETERRLAAPFVTAEDIGAEAPFGSVVSEDIINYSRVAPYVATAGVLKNAGVSEATQLGFRLIVDLRQPDEAGVDEEKIAADEIGVRHIQLPLASEDSAWRQIDVIEICRNRRIIRCLSTAALQTGQRRHGRFTELVLVLIQ